MHASHNITNTNIYTYTCISMHPCYVYVSISNTCNTRVIRYIYMHSQVYTKGNRPRIAQRDIANVIH